MFDSSPQIHEVSFQHDKTELAVIIKRLKLWDPEIDPSELKIISKQPVTWNNGSLGCAIPGKYYTQALVPGYLIWLRYKNDVLEVHTDEAFRSIAMPGVGFI